MASPYSWHPGSSTVALIKELPFQLLPDESLSSFLVRLSHQFGMTPLALTECICPGSRVWSIDTDRLNSSFLTALANWSGINKKTLYQATIRCYENLASTIPKKQDQVHPWFTTMGIRNRKRESGFSYCPECLADNPQPYFRVHWRFAWHSECIKHSCGLLDRCEQCGEPIKAHLLPITIPHLTICYNCGFDARKAKTRSLREPSARIQSYIDTTLLSGTVDVDDHTLKCSDFLDYLSFWISLLRRARRARTGALYRFLSLLPSGFPEVSEFSKGWAFEKLPVEERSVLMQGLSFITEVNLERLRFQLLSMGFSRQTFLGDWDSPPAVLLPVVHTLPDNSKTQAKARIKKGLKPVPKYLVVRKMRRLLSNFIDKQNALKH
uniref:Mll9366 protein n=1 Tax=Rheinheimera sp. BAL341 TaxID=1708203 RepID=A0A486XUT9_9GAMM